jgi:hypothetical protein
MLDFVGAVSTSPQATSSIVDASAETGRSATFHQILSELNPLQYLPIVGTIYRSVTGDTIPETARSVGSFVASGLIGGPIGLATNAALQVFSKITGIDPEKIGHNLLATLGIGTVDTDATAATITASVDAAAPQAAVPWSPLQLTAYGVTTAADGGLKRGDIRGADVLNDMELARHAVGLIV